MFFFFISPFFKGDLGTIRIWKRENQNTRTHTETHTQIIPKVEVDIFLSAPCQAYVFTIYGEP